MCWLCFKIKPCIFTPQIFIGLLEIKKTTLQPNVKIFLASINCSLYLTFHLQPWEDFFFCQGTMHQIQIKTGESMTILHLDYVNNSIVMIPQEK